MRKMIIVVALLIGFVVAVGGWWLAMGNSLARPSEGVVDVWATWGDDAGRLQPLFDRYGLSRGTPVDVTSRVGSDELLEALAGSDPPDLVILSSDLVAAYAEQGLLEPLDGWIEAAGIDLADLYTAPLARCEGPGGAYVCLPLGGDVDALFWNKELFEAAGLDPERPPQTMEEVVEYANRLTLRDETGALRQVGFVPDFFRSHADLYTRMFASDDATAPTMDSQVVIDALRWQEQLFIAYTPEELEEYLSSFTPYLTSRHARYAGRRLDCRQCHRSSPIRNGKTPETGLYEGHIAMMVDAQWNVMSSQLSSEQFAAEYGVAPFPAPSAHPERAKTTVVGGPVVIIPAGAMDKEAAASLVAWMMSPGVVADMALATSTLPASRTATRDARFREVPDFELFVDLMAHPNAKPANTTPIGIAESARR